jgi:hypothetical protein
MGVAMMADILVVGTMVRVETMESIDEMWEKEVLVVSGMRQGVD